MTPDGGTSPRFERAVLAALPFAVVCAAVLFLLWPVLIGHQSLFYRDLVQQYLGTARFLHSGEGNLLWDRFLNAGQPLLGNPNRFVLYPSRILYRVLAPAAGLNWEIALHFFLGGVGAVLLARRLRIKGLGSSVAGLAYSLSGLSVSITSHLGRFFAYQWVPWILLAVHAGLCERDRGSWRWRAAIPVLFAVQWLTGVAELVVMTAMMALAWIVVSVGADSWRQHVLSRGLVLVALGAGLAAIQIVPAAEMVFLSDRTSHVQSGVTAEWSLHPFRIAEMVVPGFCGPIDVADRGRYYWGAGLTDRGFPLILSLYLGVSVVFLAGIGCLRSRCDPRFSSLRWVFAVAVAGAVILACGAYLPVVGKILVAVPGFNLLRYPVKALLLIGLPMALLAGRGCDALLGEERVAAWRSGMAALAGGGLFLALSALVSVPLMLPALDLVFPGRGTMAAGGLSGRLLHVAVVLAAIASVGLIAGKARESIRSTLVVVVVAVDLLIAAFFALPLAPERLLGDVPPLVQELRKNLSGGRIFRDVDSGSDQVPFVENRAWEVAEVGISEAQLTVAETYLIPMAYNIDIAALSNRRMARLTRAMYEIDWNGRMKLLHAAAVEVLLTQGVPAQPGVDLVSTRKAANGLPLFLYRVSPCSSMVRWVPGVRKVASPEDALGMLVTPDIDPMREVVREVDAKMTRVPSVLAMSLRPEVEILRQNVMAPTVGFIVIALPWHPDMVVKVNGRAIPAERVNYAFTGFAVERGRYDVQVLFTSRTVFWGGLISVFSVMGWVALAIMQWRSNRRSGDQVSGESSRANSPRSA